MSAAPWSKGKCPCFQCGKRHAGCHGSCEDYQAWHKLRVEAQAEIVRKKERDNAAKDYQIREMWKNKRK